MMPLQFTLPRRRKVTKSGIERGPKRHWPKHEKWVRGFGCSRPGCTSSAPIEFAHVRSAANAGTGLKPHSAFGISLCRDCHAELHRIGQPEFERRHQINLFAVAAEFTRKSPDQAMRDSLALSNITGPPTMAEP